jgi:4,5-DOPA dioxygenase extradiol
MTLPAIFVSHGAPTLPLEPGTAGPMLAGIARELPRPRAILVVSAHWGTAAPRVTAAATPATIHDFRGFPEPLYRLRYPAAGSPELAARVTALLGQAGVAAATDADRGLDHGAWVPLLLMYPQADIPVLQLSLQPRLGPAHHLALGRALEPLTREGVLIVGSGGGSHNLGEWWGYMDAPTAPAWLETFTGWVGERVAAHDVESLLDYRARAPEAARNHPTDEHWLPFYVALGAAGGRFHGHRYRPAPQPGSHGMDAYVFEQAA